MQILGIDIGGTGIKGAPVDIQTGELLAERYRLLTPKSGKPKPMVRTIAKVAKHFDWQGPIGCGFPATVQNGVALTAANIHRKWIGTDIQALIEASTQCPTRVVNDADAAGLAEMTFGAGQGRRGVVLIITIGTGLGTALFSNGQLVPNTELGHIEIECFDAESQASDAARKRDKLSWEQWAKRFDVYLTTLEKLIWPDMVILGGGISRHYERFVPYLTVNAEVVPARLLNNAGIVGAALAAQQGGE